MSAKVRRTRDELRSLVVDAGCEVLMGIEPTLAFEQLTYGAVFSHLKQTADIRVTHASVHDRIWPNQRAFQIEVLKTTLDGFLDESYLTFIEPLRTAIESADLSSVAGRRRAAMDFVRIGQNANWDGVVLGAPNRIRIYYMLRVSLATFQPESIDSDRAELMELMRELRDGAQSSFVELIHGMCKLIGLRPRATFGDPDFAVTETARAAISTAIGFVLDELRPRDEMLFLPTGANGEVEEWRPVSVAVWNLLSGAFELDDDTLSPSERLL